jgi:hypothetical protein
MMTTTSAAATTTFYSLFYERALSTFWWPVTEKGQNANKIIMAINGEHPK